MPSPDVTPYFDLRINDKDPQDIFDVAVDDLKQVLPEWVPRETNTEVMLLEAIGMQVAENIFAINRLPDGIVEVLLQLFGIVRSNGVPPVASVTFHMINNVGYTIPAGTALRLELPGDVEPIIFTTDMDLTIPALSTTGTVTATGNRYTTDANGVVAATVLEMLDSIIAVDFADLAADITSGVDPEDDASYFDRAMVRLSRLNDTLVLPRHFAARALEQPYVGRAIAIDNWDGTGATPGTVAGHITVAVYGPNRFNTTGEKNALLAILDAESLAQLGVHVVDPNLNTQNVTVSVQGLAGYDTATIVSNLTADLQSYLSPMTWAGGSVIRQTEIITLINNSEGVDYIISLTTPGSDVTMTGNAPLPVAGTINITVTEA